MRHANDHLSMLASAVRAWPHAFDPRTVARRSVAAKQILRSFHGSVRDCQRHDPSRNMLCVGTECVVSQIGLASRQVGPGCPRAYNALGECGNRASSFTPLLLSTPAASSEETISTTRWQLVLAETTRPSTGWCRRTRCLGTGSAISACYTFLCSRRALASR